MKVALPFFHLSVFITVADAYVCPFCSLQTILATHGIQTQTQKEVEPIKIKAPGDVLMKVSSDSGIMSICFHSSSNFLLLQNFFLGLLLLIRCILSLSQAF